MYLKERPTKNRLEKVTFLAKTKNTRELLPLYQTSDARFTELRIIYSINGRKKITLLGRDSNYSVMREMCFIVDERIVSRNSYMSTFHQSTN